MQEISELKWKNGLLNVKLLGIMAEEFDTKLGFKNPGIFIITMLNCRIGMGCLIYLFMPIGNFDDFDF